MRESINIKWNKMLGSYRQVPGQLFIMFLILALTMLSGCVSNHKESVKGKFAVNKNMQVPRYKHNSILLNDNTVFILGKNDSLDLYGSIPEIYNPKTRKFKLLKKISLNNVDSRSLFKLPDGNILIFDVYRDLSFKYRSAVNIYNPKTKQVKQIKEKAENGLISTITQLNNGNLLIIYNESDIPQVYDIKTNTFSPTGKMSTRRIDNTATLLKNGKVLVAGGVTQYNGTYLKSAEIYDPVTNKFTPTGNMYSVRRGHKAVLLHCAKVLIIDENPHELYDPATGKFNLIGEMANKTPRVSPSHAAITLLKDDTVLIIGGMPQKKKCRTKITVYDPIKKIKYILRRHPVKAIIYDPINNIKYALNTEQTGCSDNSMLLSDDSDSVLLSDGKVLITGGCGIDPNGDCQPINDTMLYIPHK